MKISDIPITLRCLFCQSPLEAPEETEFSPGDLITCNRCGEENEFASVLEVAKEEGIDEMTKEVKKQLEREFKGLFKK